MQATHSRSANSIVRSEGAVEALALDRFLPYRLSILSEAVSRAFAAHYERRFNITIPEWRIMAVLGERSPQATQELIDRTRMDRVKVSRAAIRLEDKGLIVRNQSPGDRRALSLRLSRRGVAIYRELVPFAHALQAALVRDFGDGQELTEFDAALDKLLACADCLATSEVRSMQKSSPVL